MWLATTVERIGVCDVATMWYNAHNSLDKCALTAAIGAYNAQKVICEDVQIDVFEGDNAVVAYRKVAS
jgi:hypothetical protein